MEEDKKKLKDNDSSLKVEEAYTRDVGRGVARIDEETRNFLSLTAGNVVEISANEKTVAKCLHSILQFPYGDHLYASGPNRVLQVFVQILE